MFENYTYDLSYALSAAGSGEAGRSYRANPQIFGDPASLQACGTAKRIYCPEQ